MRSPHVDEDTRLCMTVEDENGEEVDGSDTVIVSPTKQFVLSKFSAVEVRDD